MRHLGRTRRTWRRGAAAVVLGVSLAACSGEGGLADTCELPASVMQAVTGIQVEAGVKSAPFEGASECLYTAADGRFVRVHVNTNSSEFNRLGGRPISGVAEGAKLAGNELYVLSSGDTWTFQVEAPNYDADRLELVLVAIANEMF